MAWGEFAYNNELVECILNGRTDLAKQLEGSYQEWVRKIEYHSNDKIYGECIVVRFNSDQYFTWKLRKDLPDSEFKNYASQLVYWGILSEKGYAEIVGGSYPKDVNENKEGYFECWECGRWMPKHTVQTDGTCGC